MSAQHRSSLSPAAGSKPATVEEAWRRHCKFSAAESRRAAWEGSSSGGAPRAGDEEEEAEEGEDPLFLEAVATSKKEAADKARADAKEAAQAIAAVKELMAREAAATTPLIILDD
jgi:hypothetical protein